MRRILRLGVAAVVAVVMIEGAGVASAATPPATTTPAPVTGGTITVTRFNDRAGFAGVFDAGQGTREISEDLGAPSGGGSGAVILGTPTNDDKVMAVTRATNGPLSGFVGNITYWARTGPPPEAPPSFQPQPAPYALSGSEPSPDGNHGPDGDHGPDGNWGSGGDHGPDGDQGPRESPRPVPSFQIVIDALGTPAIQPRQVYVLTYYPDSVTDDWTQFDAGSGRYCVFQQIGRFDADAHRTGCADGERRTLSDISGQFPNAAVLYAGVNQGGGNGGTTTAVDLIHIKDTTYDFEVGGPE